MHRITVCLVYPERTMGNRVQAPLIVAFVAKRTGRLGSRSRGWVARGGLAHVPCQTS